MSGLSTLALCLILYLVLSLFRLYMSGKVCILYCILISVYNAMQYCQYNTTQWSVSGC